MALEGKYGQINVPGIPEDEPIFILRAQDMAALQTLDGYADEAVECGASDEFAFAVSSRERQDSVFMRFQTWQETHPDKVKTPD